MAFLALIGMQRRRLIFILIFLGFIASTCAIDKASEKMYKERFKTCDEFREIFKGDELIKQQAKCKFLARCTVYDDCIDEEEQCVKQGKKDCYKNLLRCLETYAEG